MSSDDTEPGRESRPATLPALIPAEGAAEEQVSPLAQQPPPHPLDGYWYIAVDGKTYGPNSGHQMKRHQAEGRVRPESLVRAADGDAWTTAGADPVLSHLFQSPPPPV